MQQWNKEKCITLCAKHLKSVINSELWLENQTREASTGTVQNAYNTLVVKHEVNSSVGRPRRRRENIIQNGS
jgi:hypothetical protein